MKKAIILAVIALGAISVGASAKAPSARAQVFAAVTHETKTDTVVKSTPAKVNASISQVDLNGDGLPDYAVDYQKFSTPAWCGTGGCRYQLWLSLPGGKAKRVFDGQMLSLKTRKGAHGTIFDFDFHGGVCGGTGSDDCPISFAYDAKAGKMVAVPGPGQTKVKHRTDAIDHEMYK